MEQYTVAKAIWKIRTQFGHHEELSRSATVKINKKFEEIGSVTNQKKSHCKIIWKFTRNFEENVANGPCVSIPSRSQRLNISRSSLHLILHLDLHLHPYKMQLTKELKPADYAQHRAFSSWVLEMQATGDLFTKLSWATKLIFI